MTNATKNISKVKAKFSFDRNSNRIIFKISNKFSNKISNNPKIKNSNFHVNY